MIDLDILAQSVDFVVVGEDLMLDLALLPHSLRLRPILLQVGLAGIGHLLIEGRQAVDSLNEVNRKELVIDGGVARLVALQIGEIAGIGVWMGRGVLLLICLLSCIKCGEKVTTLPPMQRRPALEFRTTSMPLCVVRSQC